MPTKALAVQVPACSAEDSEEPTEVEESQSLEPAHTLAFQIQREDSERGVARRKVGTTASNVGLIDLGAIQDRAHLQERRGKHYAETVLSNYTMELDVDNLFPSALADPRLQKLKQGIKGIPLQAVRPPQKPSADERAGLEARRAVRLAYHCALREPDKMEERLETLKQMTLEKAPIAHFDPLKKTERFRHRRAMYSGTPFWVGTHLPQGRTADARDVKNAKDANRGAAGRAGNQVMGRSRSAPVLPPCGRTMAGVPVDPADQAAKPHHPAKAPPGRTVLRWIQQGMLPQMVSPPY